MRENQKQGGPYTDEELVGILNEEISRSEGWDTDELAANRTSALNAFYGRDRGDEKKGRSQVQSLDVADMVHAVLAQMMPAFSSDCVVSFDPVSEQDEEQAAHESAAVDAQLFDLNTGYLELHTAIQDILLQRNGHLKVWVDDQVDAVSEKYTALPDEALAMLLEPEQAGQTIQVTSLTEVAGGQDVTITRTTTAKRLRTMAVAPENFLIEKEWESLELTAMGGVRFIAERRIETQTSLLGMGLDVPDQVILDLPTYSGRDKTDDVARTAHSTDSEEAQDQAMRNVLVYECYAMLDQDGDGAAELHRIILGSPSAILLNEPAPRRPYVSGTAILRAHRFNGISLYDRLKEIQDGKTGALRQWMDNLNHANNARVKIRDGRVTMEDLADSAPARWVRMRDMGDLEAFPFTDVGPSALAALEYHDKMRSERGGASLDLQSAEIQGAQEISGQSLERQYGVREQLAANMTRLIAHTLIRGWYLLTHAVMREQLAGEQLQLRTGGQWMQVDPGQWPERAQVTVKVGMSTAERASRVQSLQMVLMQQKEALGMGLEGIITDRGKVWNTLLDLTQAADLPDASTYWINPDSPAAVEAAKRADAGNQQQQAMMVQMQQQAADQQRQHEASLQQMQLQFEHWKTTQETMVKQLQEWMKGEIEEAKIVGEATLDLERAQDTAEAGASGGNGAA